MRRIVKSSSLRKTVSFRKSNDESGTEIIYLTKAPSTCTNGSRNYGPSSPCDFTFGSIAAHHLADASSSEPSTVNTPISDRSPTDNYHGLGCGHDSIDFFTCNVCMNRYCPYKCQVVNTCSHKSCRSCSVRCVTCKSQVCVQCMNRCSECFSKLCGISCGFACGRCKEIVCAECAAKKLVKKRTETFLCSQCVDEVSEDGGDKEWKVMLTENGKPGFIVYKNGTCFSTYGKYIGKFEDI